ncbi:hypothetical protein KP509_11G000800 [Ceratopteris richardii]|nr:hypothetical protein KP509_11G000800 [Ceratopteris richardii]
MQMMNPVENSIYTDGEKHDAKPTDRLDQDQECEKLLSDTTLNESLEVQESDLNYRCKNELLIELQYNDMYVNDIVLHEEGHMNDHESDEDTPLITPLYIDMYVKNDHVELSSYIKEIKHEVEDTTFNEMYDKYDVCIASKNIECETVESNICIDEARYKCYQMDEVSIDSSVYDEIFRYEVFEQDSMIKEMYEECGKNTSSKDNKQEIIEIDKEFDDGILNRETDLTSNYMYIFEKDQENIDECRFSNESYLEKQEFSDLDDQDFLDCDDIEFLHDNGQMNLGKEEDEEFLERLEIEADSIICSTQVRRDYDRLNHENEHNLQSKNDEPSYSQYKSYECIQNLNCNEEESLDNHNGNDEILSNDFNLKMNQNICMIDLFDDILNTPNFKNLYTCAHLSCASSYDALERNVNKSNYAQMIESWIFEFFKSYVCQSSLQGMNEQMKWLVHISNLFKNATLIDAVQRWLLFKHIFFGEYVLKKVRLKEESFSIKFHKA